MEFLKLVSEVSKGDLTRRGEVTADMFGNLADAFNLMLDRFSKLLGQVNEAAVRVNESARGMRGMAGQMAMMSQQQEQESTQTLAAVEGLAIAMRQVASTAGTSSERDRKSTRLNSSHLVISYAVFCLKKKKNNIPQLIPHIIQKDAFCVHDGCTPSVARLNRVIASACSVHGFDSWLAIQRQKLAKARM